MAELVIAGQQTGVLRQLPLTQALTFLAGAVAFPSILMTLATEQHIVPAPFLAHLDTDVLSDAAIAQRVGMAIRGLRTESEGPHA
jgi:hypothetical protein